MLEIKLIFLPIRWRIYNNNNKNENNLNLRIPLKCQPERADVPGGFSMTPRVISQAWHHQLATRRLCHPSAAITRQTGLVIGSSSISDIFETCRTLHSISRRDCRITPQKKRYGRQKPEGGIIRQGVKTQNTNRGHRLCF